MEPKQLAELLRGLREKATPGPWMASPQVGYEKYYTDAALVCALVNHATEIIAALEGAKDGEVNSRSRLKRIAALKGEPAPDFSAINDKGDSND